MIRNRVRVGEIPNNLACSRDPLNAIELEWSCHAPRYLNLGINPICVDSIFQWQSMILNAHKKIERYNNVANCSMFGQ